MNFALLKQPTPIMPIRDRNIGHTKPHFDPLKEATLSRQTHQNGVKHSAKNRESFSQYLKSTAKKPARTNKIKPKITSNRPTLKENPARISYHKGSSVNNSTSEVKHKEVKNSTPKIKAKEERSNKPLKSEHERSDKPLKSEHERSDKPLKSEHERSDKPLKSEHERSDKSLKSDHTNNRDIEDIVMTTPILAFLTGKLEYLSPDEIPSTVLNSSFINSALAQEDPTKFINTPMNPLGIIKSLGIESGSIIDAIGSKLNLNQPITPQSFLKAIGLDPTRITCELSLLKSNLQLEGLIPYIKRAAKISLPKEVIITHDALKNEGLLNSPPLTKEHLAANATSFGLKDVNTPIQMSSFDTNQVQSYAKYQAPKSNGGVSNHAINTNSPLLELESIVGPIHMSHSEDPFNNITQKADPNSTLIIDGKNIKIPLQMTNNSDFQLNPITASTAPHLKAHKPHLDPTKLESQQFSWGTHIGENPTKSLSSIDTLKLFNNDKGNPLSDVSYGNSIKNLLHPNNRNVRFTTEANRLTLSCDSGLEALNTPYSQEAGLGRNLQTESMTLSNKNIKAFGVLSPELPNNTGIIDTIKGAHTKLDIELPHTVPISKNNSFTNGERSSSFNHDQNGKGGFQSKSSEFLPESLAAFNPSLKSTDSVITAKENTISQLNNEFIIQKIIDKASMMVKEGGGSIRLNLGTKDLGHIDLAINIMDQKLDLRIVADSDKARDLLVSELPRLKETLYSHNLDLNNVEISIGTEKSYSQSYQDGDSLYQRHYDRWEENSFSQTKDRPFTPLNIAKERGLSLHKNSLINMHDGKIKTWI